MRQQKVDFFLLLLIILTGTLLRFVYFDRCPYTHDEISSLTRANYSSFSELIEQGVKPDTHPPLLQIFLQYYTKVFGTSEMVVKFPFVICGIVSILLVYLIAAKWFGRTAGLLSAAVVSTIQYTVMYSVIARHYSLGLFLTLFLVYCQINFFEAENKRKFLWLGLFTAAGVACSYLHYFCLLFTAIVALTGFLFINRKNFWQYFIACLLIPLLFIPYLPVFFVQFGYKGIGGASGWLGAPDSSFFLKYIRYIFHYSDLFFILIIALFLFGIITGIMHRNNIFSKYRFITLAWFLIPLLTGYFYSVKVNPILQFSILIFSFPYLLMFLFSFIGEIKPLMKTSFVVLILSISTVTLVFGRKHYDLFYNQGMPKVIAEINNAKQQFGNDSVDAVVDVEDYFLDYYNKNFPPGRNSKYIALGINNDMRSFIKTVSESKKNYFVFGTVRVYPLECLQIVKEYFPYVVSQYKGHLTEVITCSKIPVDSARNDETIFSSENNFSSKQTGWNFDEKRVLQAPDDTTLVIKYFNYEAPDEFGIEFQIPLEEIIKSKNDLLHMRAGAFMHDTAHAPLLVMEMKTFDKTVDWRAAKFSDYFGPLERGKVYLSLRLSDLRIDTRNTTLKDYIWNKDHSTFILYNLKVSSEKGNPYFYGLFEEF